MVQTCTENERRTHFRSDRQRATPNIYISKQIHLAHAPKSIGRWSRAAGESKNVLRKRENSAVNLHATPQL